MTDTRKYVAEEDPDRPGFAKPVPSLPEYDQDGHDPPPFGAVVKYKKDGTPMKRPGRKQMTDGTPEQMEKRKRWRKQCTQRATPTPSMGYDSTTWKGGKKVPEPIYDEKGRRICGAKLRNRPGEICHCNPLKGRNRCKLHGGNRVRGPEAPAYRHGKYSHCVPQQLEVNYQAMLKDPEILSLKEDIALQRAHMLHALQQIDFKEVGVHFQQLGKHMKTLKTAIRQGKVADLNAAIASIESILEDEGRNRDLWADVQANEELIRKLVETEHRRMVDNQYMMTVEQGMGLVAGLASIVRRHITDETIKSLTAQTILDRIATELDRHVRIPALESAERVIIDA